MVGDKDADRGHKTTALTMPDEQVKFSYWLVAEYQIWKQKQPDHHTSTL